MWIGMEISFLQNIWNFIQIMDMFLKGKQINK